MTGFIDPTLSQIDYKVWLEVVTEDFAGKWTQTPDCGYTIEETFEFYEKSSTSVYDLISHEAGGYIRVADPSETASWEADKGKIFVSTTDVSLAATYERYVELYLCVDDDQQTAFVEEWVYKTEERSKFEVVITDPCETAVLDGIQFESKWYDGDSNLMAFTICDNEAVVASEQFVAGDIMFPDP